MLKKRRFYRIFRFDKVFVDCFIDDGSKHFFVFFSVKPEHCEKNLNFTGRKGLRERERYSAVTVSKETGFYRVINFTLLRDLRTAKIPFYNYKRAKSNLMCKLSELSNTNSILIESYFQIE